MLLHASPSGSIAPSLYAHPEVAPREHDVVGLDLRCRGQHDVGVARGVGDELFVDDGEQVVAGEAPDCSAFGIVTSGLQFQMTIVWIAGSSSASRTEATHVHCAGGLRE